MNGNDTFLDINNAHLRVNNGNVQASTFVLDQIDFIASSNASTTVGFNNPTTAFLAASNIEVGTANLFVDTSTSNVGIGTNAPQDTLHINGGTRIAGHILPTVNDTYDLGSAEYKIRHLFLGNSSLWLGDETRITFTGGKMKFRRRKKNALPRGLATIAAARGHTSEQQTTAAALAYAGVSTVEEMKLEHWIDYTKTLDETKEINDIFTEDAADYEATTASEAFKEIGDDIFSPHNVSIGKSTAPTSALDVNGTVKATAFEGDGSALTGITSGQWTESSGDIYRSSGNVGIGVTNPGSVLEVSDTLTNYKIKAVTLNGVPEGGAYYGYILLAKAATGGIDSESYAMGRILARRGSSTSGHKINYYDVVSSRGYNHYETFSVNHVGNRTGNDGFTSTVKVTYNGVVYHALRTGSTGGQPTTDLAFWGASKDAALIMVDSSMISNETSYGHIAFSAVNGNVGIGKIPDAGKKLDVNGTVKATAFEGDGSALTGISSGQWTDSGGNIYRSSGNVGIGTTNPRNLLELKTTGSTTDDSALLLLYKTTGNGVGIDFCDQNSFLQKGYLRYHHQDSQAFGLRNCFRFSSTESSESLVLGGCLHIGVDGKDGGYMTNSTGSGRRNLFIQSTYNGNTSQNYGWWIGAQNQALSSTDNDLYFGVLRNGTINVPAIIQDDKTSATIMNFTGQHRTFVKDTPTNQLDDKEGLIVVADQNEFIKMSGGVAYGNDAITINESLPLVSLSTKAKDKRCFGVLSTTEDPETRKEVHGNFASLMQKEEGDTRVYVNSVGEGAIWVVNTNGTLESGDYITTSNVAGYGMKQDDDILHNYTVAKILMDCDFNPSTQVKRVIKKESRMVDYWIRYGDVKINEEEYQSLPETNRKIVEDVHYRIDQMEVVKENPEKDTFVYEQREDMVNVLDEHGEFQWEDHPTETEKAYKIRYLDANGVETNEANAVYKAAFVGCTYHCG